MRLTRRGERLLASLFWTCVSVAVGVAVFLTLLVVTPDPAPQEVIPTPHSSQQGR